MKPQNIVQSCSTTMTNAGGKINFKPVSDNIATSCSFFAVCNYFLVGQRFNIWDLFSERDAGARFAPLGTFEHEWCQKWKQLDEMKRTQLEALEKQFREAEEKLETDMVQAVADYEAEINRRGMVVGYKLTVCNLHIIFHQNAKTAHHFSE